MRATVFHVGDRVKTLPVASYTDLANMVYAGREAVIVAIHSPFGLHTQYEVEYVKPFLYLGCDFRTHSFYDFDNALELIN